MSETGTAQNTRGPGPLRGLSGKVLLLTIIFVMIGEVLIFVPSIANFRITWLKNRVAQAEIAALAVEAAPTRMLSPDLRNEILKGAGVRVVALQKGGTRQLVLRSDVDAMIDASYDLRTIRWFPAIVDAFTAMAAGDGRVIGITDIPPNMSGESIQIALDEAPLRAAMFGYALNILILSIILSILVAGLVFLALNRVLVRPMQRLTQNMLAFAERPEDPTRLIAPSERKDEIGLAERELHDMQQQLQTMLQQKSRLAALGLAVSKVSHDLRNMLSSAQIISDRLSMVEDPTVQKFAPKLIASLDRAITFCVQTLTYGRAQEAPPQRERCELRPIVEEVVDTAVAQASQRIALYNNVGHGTIIDADREHLFRVLTNLVRNAVQAIETSHANDPSSRDGSITIRAWREGSVCCIEIRDNGPGIPEKVRERLFEAFQSASRAGGTGLGLAIASELVRAHGGEIRLAETGESGTSFVVSVPDHVTELRSGRRGEQPPAAGRSGGA
jgi:signal transduction histidine kinase